MPVEIVVVAESAADARIVTGLCEREMLERELADGVLFNELERRYQGIEPGTDFVPWSRLAAIIDAKNSRLRKLSWGKGKGRPDYSAALKVIALLVLSPDRPRPAFILFSRDTDNDMARWDSLRDVQREHGDAIAIRLAVQHPKIEAWLLNGFEPENEPEKARLRGSAKRLGFDPTKRAERLTARGNKGKRNAKSVLKELTGDDPERRDRCWQQTALAVLRERGIETGLAEFLDQIDFA